MLRIRSYVIRSQLKLKRKFATSISDQDKMLRLALRGSLRKLDIRRAAVTAGGATAVGLTLIGAAPRQAIHCVARGVRPSLCGLDRLSLCGPDLPAR